MIHWDDERTRKYRSCPGCGAPITNRGGIDSTCPYCGVQYEWTPVLKTTITVDSPEIVRLTSEVSIDQVVARDFGSKETKKIVIETLKKEIASQLDDFMIVEEDYDIKRGKTICRGIVKVGRINGV